MLIEEAIYNLLTNYADLTALVGDRIYPGTLPQITEAEIASSFPAISYFKISGARHHNIDVAYPRFQFDAWDTVYLKAKQVAEQIRHAFQRYKGTMGEVKVIQGTYLNELDLYNSEAGLFQVPVDIKILYREQ